MSSIMLLVIKTDMFVSRIYYYQHHCQICVLYWLIAWRDLQFKPLKVKLYTKFVNKGKRITQHKINYMCEMLLWLWRYFTIQ